jgi:hypothetical protein
MVTNFRETGCPLAGISFFNSLKDIANNYNNIFKPKEEDDKAPIFNFEIYDMNQVSTQCLN